MKAYKLVLLKKFEDIKGYSHHEFDHEEHRELEYFIKGYELARNEIAKTDIKYLGVPNICFSLTDKDDSRESEYSEQRISRGFDDSETWALANTIAKFIIPRLKRFIEISNDHFIRSTHDYELFLRSLELINRDNGSWIFTESEENELEKGLKLFPEIFQTLWW